LWWYIISLDQAATDLSWILPGIYNVSVYEIETDDLAVFNL